MSKPKKPVMPKCDGLRMDLKTGKSWVAYKVSLTINPADFGVSGDADNATMADAVVKAMVAQGARRERAAIAAVLKGRAATLRDRKALGAADEVEALAFYLEQRGELAAMPDTP